MAGQSRLLASAETIRDRRGQEWPRHPESCLGLDGCRTGRRMGLQGFDPAPDEIATPPIGPWPD